MKDLEFVMHLYMYELEKYLLTKRKDILELKFNSDEANIDKPLKDFMKKVIENEFNSIPETDIYSINIDGQEINFNIDDFKILRALLKDEITNDIKKEINNSKKESSVYTNPDICLEILFNNKIYYRTIELKSTKNDDIPGSSVKQVVHHEWVIFIQRKDEKVDITTGYYINSVEKIIFPDRSPRTAISFEKLKKWNDLNRKINKKTIYYTNNKDNYDIQKKEKLINNWEDTLSNEWLTSLNDTKKNRSNEQWFKQQLRNFIIKFLDFYENLETIKQKNFKSNILKILNENKNK
nr:hypothetical protein [Mycoplasmopsis canis]WQQ12619.1 hypothetical protein RRG48_01050 [Mycoplasmopsis canis]